MYKAKWDVIIMTYDVLFFDMLTLCMINACLVVWLYDKIVTMDERYEYYENEAKQ